MRLWAKYKIKNAVTVNIICINWKKIYYQTPYFPGLQNVPEILKLLCLLPCWIGVECIVSYIYILCSCFTAKLHALLNSSASSQQPPSLTKPSPSHHWETNDESLSEESRLACV